jgi:hypothetical protein
MAVDLPLIGERPAKLSTSRAPFAVCVLAHVPIRRWGVLGLAAVTIGASARAQEPITRLSVRPAPRVLQIVPPPDASFDIGHASDITFGPDGSVYVADAFRHVVHVFDDRGRRRAEFGRPGSGPGDLKNPGALSLLGDTLFVVNMDEGRVTGFDRTTGRRLADFAVTSRGVLPQGGRALLQGVIPGGLLLLVARQATVGAVNESIGWDYAAADRAGRVTRRLASIPPAASSFRVPQRVQGEGLQPSGIGRAPQLYLDGPLGRILTSTGEWAVLDRSPPTPGANTASLVLTVYAASGEVRRKLDVPYRPGVLPRAVVQRVIDSLTRPVSQRGGVIVTLDRRTVTDSLYVPSHWPAVRGFTIAPNGEFLLAKGGPYTPLQEYWFHDAEARLTARVSIPSGFLPLKMQDGVVYGSNKDPDGLVLIEAYRVGPLVRSP